MKPFDPDATCPKCGFDSVATQFVSAGSEVRFDYTTQQKVEWRHLRVESDFIDRRCHRCGYRWQEAVAAATASVVAEPKLELTSREPAPEDPAPKKQAPKRKRSSKTKARVVASA